MGDYHQCVLKTKDGRETVGWVKKEHAVLGSIVTLEDDISDRLWKVTFVGTKALSKEQVRTQERLHTKHRQTTDI